MKTTSLVFEEGHTTQQGKSNLLGVESESKVKLKDRFRIFVKTYFMHYTIILFLSLYVLSNVWLSDRQGDE